MSVRSRWRAITLEQGGIRLLKTCTRAAAQSLQACISQASCTHI
eukprot:jgi/Botrbrau1/14091/Bobra.182_3s0037.1